MSLGITAAEQASISADLLSAFAPTPARLIRAQPAPDGTGGEEDGHQAYRTISIGISDRQFEGTAVEGSRTRSIVTATGRVSIAEIEYIHERDTIELETGDAREFEHWTVDSIVVGQFLATLSLTREEES